MTELSPSAAEAHMNRGVDFMRQRDFDRAIEALTLATTVNPKLATAFSNLGTAYQKKGDLDAAIDSYSRAITLRAKYPIAFANRAYSHYLKGDHDLAIADATHALTLDPRAADGAPESRARARGEGRHRPGGAQLSTRPCAESRREVEEETLEALEKLGVRARRGRGRRRLMKLLLVIVEGSSISPASWRSSWPSSRSCSGASGRVGPSSA